MIGFYIYQYCEKSTDPKLKSIINEPKFLPMNEVTECLTLPKGDYIIMCSLF